MTRSLLAALALACICLPAMAAESSDAVTWGALGFGAILIIGGIAVVALILFVLSVIASGFNH